MDGKKSTKRIGSKNSEIESVFMLDLSEDLEKGNDDSSNLA